MIEYIAMRHVRTCEVSMPKIDLHLFDVKPEQHSSQCITNEMPSDLSSYEINNFPKSKLPKKCDNKWGKLSYTLDYTQW